MKNIILLFQKQKTKKKIEIYINNSFSSPKEECKKIENDISKSNDYYSTVIFNQIQEFKNELEKIKSDLREKIKLYNPKINFNESLFKNYSKGN